jgi:hypothetical protein
MLESNVIDYYRSISNTQATLESDVLPLSLPAPFSKEPFNISVSVQESPLKVGDLFVCYFLCYSKFR